MRRSGNEKVTDFVGDDVPERDALSLGESPGGFEGSKLADAAVEDVSPSVVFGVDYSQTHGVRSSPALGREFVDHHQNVGANGKHGAVAAVQPADVEAGPLENVCGRGLGCLEGFGVDSDSIADSYGERKRPSDLQIFRLNHKCIRGVQAKKCREPEWPLHSSPPPNA